MNNVILQVVKKKSLFLAKFIKMKFLNKSLYVGTYVITSGQQFQV